jgi:prepilin-type N-terminal cleavage/methylation domain-containing protein
MVKLLRRKSQGITLIELVIVVAILGMLAAVAIPNLLAAQEKSKYARAAADTKTATTQAIVYANDKNQNPGTLTALRTGGYAYVPDNDPWGTPYKLSGAFQNTSTPVHSEMGVCSVGPARASGVTDAYCVDGFDRVFQGTQPGREGSVGYSSIYGSWQGQV